MLEDDRQGVVPDYVPLADIHLTARESSVLTLVIGGSTSREAGLLLGVSPRTVEFHRANIMQKFSARNVADLVRMIERGRWLA
jgi:FixJ family two-component response regulator